ncbi:hypothetical protein H5T87_09180 [bacterium]|nr:hypothetical protein [bacterium]
MSEEEGLKESCFSKRVDLLFRHAIPEIPSTTYGTFSIYKYPAKFIPQVIAYVLKKYTKPGMRVFDPFAGYGTVGIVARVYGNEYEMWDLNPLLEVIHEVAIMKMPKVDIDVLIKDIRNSKNEFYPRWSNLNYWFPQEFLPLLSKAWGFFHSLKDERRSLLVIPLINVTRYFSWGDEKVHKLYKSKYAKRKIEELLKSDWEGKFYDMLEKEIWRLLRKIGEYKVLKPRDVKYHIRAGVDSLEENLTQEVDLLITSPPYLQAQEYIRSTKLELFWLGYGEDYIKELTKKELPYRDVAEIKVHSEKFYKYREQIKEKHLRVLYDRYFYAILGVFARLGEKVREYMCIFLGPAKIRNVSIPIDEIVVEHLKSFGWTHEVTYIDRIVGRVMFETSINPASGVEDSRIKTEHLVVLKRE